MIKIRLAICSLALFSTASNRAISARPPSDGRGTDGLAPVVSSEHGSAGLRSDLTLPREARKHADRIKLRWWDGQGFCLFYKICGRGYFPSPTAKDDVANLTEAQLSTLVEGIDWCQRAWTCAVGRAG